MNTGYPWQLLPGIWQWLGPLLAAAAIVLLVYVEIVRRSRRRRNR